MKSLAVFLGVIASCLVFSNCGGGGGENTTAAATVRPKTLDGLRLTLDSNVVFEFVRTGGTLAAIASGDVETGTFYYTLGGVQRRQYPNTGGDNSDCQYPDQVTTASYTYRAINDSSGLLTLNGIGKNDLITTGGFNAKNGSFCYFFNSDSGGAVINKIEIDLTFSSNGSVVTLGTSTVRIPGSSTPLWDTVRIPTTVMTVAGAALPTNYNPTISPTRISTIVPATLNSKLLVFTNGSGRTANDFTIQFAADASGVNGLSSAGEIGRGLLRITGAVVDNAVDYNWRILPGTDSSTLTISGSNSTLDGSYTLSFYGVDNGRYDGTLDAGTTDVLDVTGTFAIPGGT